MTGIDQYRKARRKARRELRIYEADLQEWRERLDFWERQPADPHGYIAISAREIEYAEKHRGRWAAVVDALTAEIAAMQAAAKAQAAEAAAAAAWDLVRDTNIGGLWREMIGL